MKKSYNMLFSNTIIFTIGNIGSKLILFLLLPLYTNILSTDQYGVIEIILATSNLLIPIVSLSIEEAILRYGLDNESDNGEIIKNAFVVVLVGSIILLCGSLVATRFIAYTYLIIYFTLITILRMIQLVVSIYAKAINKNRIFAINSLLFTFFFALFNVILLVHFKWELIGYFVATILATFISIVFLFIQTDVLNELYKSRINKKLLRKMLRYSIPMIFNSLAMWINNSSDRFILKLLMSTSAVGLYSVSAKIPILLTTITGIFNQAWIISSIAEYSSSSSKNFYEKIFSIYCLALIIFSSALMLIIKPFMNIYVGESFVEAWRYVPFLLIGSVFLGISSFFGSIYIAEKKTKNIMLTTLFGAIINIILNFILIHRIGIMGAIMATMITYIFMGLYRMFDSRKYFEFRIKFQSLFISLLLLLFQSILISFEINYYQLPIIIFIIILIQNHSDIKRIVVLISKFIHGKVSLFKNT